MPDTEKRKRRETGRLQAFTVMYVHTRARFNSYPSYPVRIGACSIINKAGAYPFSFFVSVFASKWGEFSF